MNLSKLLSGFCCCSHASFRVMIGLLTWFAFPATASAQLAPTTLTFPSPLILDGVYFDTQDEPPEETPLTRDYRLISSSGITDGLSNGSYIYSKTAPNQGTLKINVAATGDGFSEQSQITYLLTFTSVSAGTCTFSGSFSGVDEDGPYSGSVYSGSGNFSLANVARTLQEWRERYFADTGNPDDAADDFDFDKDGVPNLVEYALGTSPLDPGSVQVPQSSLVSTSGQRYLSISIEKPSGVSGITYTVEVSDRLGGIWTDGNGATTVLTDNGSTLIVRDSKPVSASNPRRFIRLRVTAQ